LITMIGVVFFSESFNLRKLFYIGLIVAGVIGLKTSSDPIASLPDDNTTNF